MGIRDLSISYFTTISKTTLAIEQSTAEPMQESPEMSVPVLVNKEVENHQELIENKCDDQKSDLTDRHSSSIGELMAKLGGAVIVHKTLIELFKMSADVRNSKKVRLKCGDYAVELSGAYNPREIKIAIETIKQIADSKDKPEIIVECRVNMSLPMESDGLF